MCRLSLNSSKDMVEIWLCVGVCGRARIFHITIWASSGVESPEDLAY